MLLYEGEGKQLLARYGISVPRGRLAHTTEEAALAQNELSCAVMLKAQVQAGGRGKAGLIRSATATDVRTVADGLLMSTHGNEPVRALLVEERLDADAEHFVAAYLDTAKRERVMLISASGGIDVEAHRDNVRSIAFTGASAPSEESVALAWRQLGVPEAAIGELVGISSAVARCFLEERARLVEVNPIGLLGGRAVALDAKVIVEDDARLNITRVQSAADPLEEEAGRLGLPMVRLDGDIGVITSGAGLGLATVDTISACGARAANFLDLGGGATPDRMKTAIELVIRLGKLRAIFINVHGGLNDCVLLAEGVIASGIAEKHPIMVRMSGYRATEGQALLRASKIRNAGAEPMASCIRSLITATGRHSCA